MESRKDEVSNPESRLLYELRNERIRPSFFNGLAKDVTRLISCHYEYNTNSEIGIALNHAAYARMENVTALMAMLEKKPHLLLQRGRVITPGGHDVRNITLYEFCLGAGDSDLARQVQAYFAKITSLDGEAERVQQYERYRPHIEAIMTRKPYNITPLVAIIKQASTADVTAFLNKDMSHESVLRDAIIAFRQVHAPRIINRPCMHFNYRSVQHALEVLNREWDNLYRTSGSNHDKIHLMWCQISFEMRRLPGVDRCRVAQGLDNYWERMYQYKNDTGEFPVTLTDDSPDGLGVDYGVDMYYGVRAVAPLQLSPMWSPPGLDSLVAGPKARAKMRAAIGEWMSDKNIRLIELMPQPEQTAGCVIS